MSSLSTSNTPSVTWVFPRSKSTMWFFAFSKNTDILSSNFGTFRAEIFNNVDFLYKGATSSPKLLRESITLLLRAGNFRSGKIPVSSFGKKVAKILRFNPNAAIVVFSGAPLAIHSSNNRTSAVLSWVFAFGGMCFFSFLGSNILLIISLSSAFVLEIMGPPSPPVKIPL